MAEYTKVGLNAGDALHEADADTYETQYDCAKTEFETGSWKIKKDLVPDADDSRAVGSLAYRLRTLYSMLVRESRAHFRDDFHGQALDGRWRLTGTGSSGAIVADVDGGVYSVGCSSGSGNYGQLDWNGKRAFRHSKNAEFWANIALQQTVQLTVRVGLYKDATHYIYLENDPVASAVNWYAKSHNGSTPNSVDTTILGSTAVRDLQIRCASGHIYFDVDGVNKVDMTTNIPTDYFEPFIYCYSKESAVKAVYLDWVDVVQDR